MDNTDTEETTEETGAPEGLGYDPIAILEATMDGKAPPKSYLTRDSDADDDSLSVLRSLRPRDQPQIDHLRDAVITSPDGRPEVIVPPGGRIVIERRASVIDGAPWLDTKVYDVRGVDQEAGILRLWDPELHHHARENWFVGLSVGSRYKLPPAKGRWDAPPRAKAAAAAPVVVAAAPAGEPGTKPRRGRPPGTKNRSKEVIAAEKAERAAAKADKRGRRSKKAVAQ